MSAGKTPAILSWVEEVARSVPETPPNTERLVENASTPASQHKRKRSVFEAENPMSQSDPHKISYRTTSETASTVSVRLADEIISLAPSSSAASRGGGRSRSSSPSRVKAELATAIPRVVYIHESADPKSRAASQLLADLTQDSEFSGNEDVAQKISSASCQCATEFRSEGSWVHKVALPLLESAIAELPLECWSIQTESVDPQYQPRYTARDTYNRKIDLVVGLPVNAYEVQYEKAGLHTTGKYFSHMTHPHTGKRVLGPGVEIKAADGNLVEAQVQIGVWMTGLLMWAFAQRKSVKDLPPLVGCTAVGEDWKFYIATGVEESGVLKEVRIWGPLSDLDGRTTSVKHTTSLLGTLRRVMEYTIGQYKEGIFRAIPSVV
ncbi:hypothetical protein DTO006G1_6754 [Penicillium roqueforti]|uniref:uncharacterized protein n=1 Tax=Penicillium roqueforti TaxID=5082 RepID=UPI00190A47A1|nr:uncharacterized protein LCP9604111_3257 [Penicillium roqueforti]KAF9250355.1 hypothetical protein LCP9604111_3257 [Penicillium roqueforti]KAI1833043.1 hypothetical protein CBS147337_6000 [Penicillium roqueforti]KAI2671644.1 hypothetical protein CBS147355_8636 [Penicillium roqueforti]KAI2703388.1 hypothetical protein CBS147372_3703 [Penicillium roqueforti]KAI2707885.1 hypothetical protein CBS147354_9363 [Penicillium roqueforti]